MCIRVIDYSVAHLSLILSSDFGSVTLHWLGTSAPQFVFAGAAGFPGVDPSIHLWSIADPSLLGDISTIPIEQVLEMVNVLYLIRHNSERPYISCGNVYKKYIY